MKSLNNLLFYNTRNNQYYYYNDISFLFIYDKFHEGFVKHTDGIGLLLEEEIIIKENVSFDEALIIVKDCIDLEKVFV